MTRTQQLLQRLEEVLGSFPTADNSVAKTHRITHRLVRDDAQRAGIEHGDKIRAGLEGKNLPKSYVNATVRDAAHSFYLKHYNKAYPNTRREVQRNIIQSY